MTVRIWLTAAAAKAVETKEEPKPFTTSKMHDVSRFNGFEVKSDQAGAVYIDFNVDPFDPASYVPNIGHKYIKRVSFLDKYFEGFRTDGIYKLKGATARVETEERYISAGNLHESGHEERYQNISISAGSIRTLREIYTLVRQGKLQPTEDWGTDLQVLEERREREAALKAAEGGTVETAH